MSQAESVNQRVDSRVSHHGRHQPVSLALVIVSFNSFNDVRRLLDSVEGDFGGRSWRVYVVDNANEPHLPSFELERVEVLRPGRNLGYSGAINYAMARIGEAEWIAIANPDTAGLEIAVSSLLQFARGDELAAYVPLMVDSDGRHRASLRREPRLSSTLAEALLGDAWPTRPAWMQEVVRDASSYTTRHAVDWSTGALLVYSLQTARTVGEWDESFRLYSEEVDYMRRIRLAGGQIHFIPNAIVGHAEGGSGRSPELEALSLLSRLTYFSKWHGRLPARLHAAAIVVGVLVRWRRPGLVIKLKVLLFPVARSALLRGLNLE